LERQAHLSLKDLWEYLNRYTYLPRLKDKTVLVKTVQAAVANMLPGPFAYAERWDEAAQSYRGLVIDRSPSALVVIDADSVIVKPAIAETHRAPSDPPSDPPPGERSRSAWRPDGGPRYR
jgi:uncharacterized protein